jgi:hypothetical protein
MDIIVPPHWLGCRAPKASRARLCLACWHGLTLIEQNFCERLAILFVCDRGEGAAIDLVHRLKKWRAHGGSPLQIWPPADVAPCRRGRLETWPRPDLAPFTGMLMTQAPRDSLDCADMLIAAPLHRLRLWRRRSDQAAPARPRGHEAWRRLPTAAAHKTREHETSSRPQPQRARPQPPGCLRLAAGRPPGDQGQAHRPGRRRPDFARHRPSRQPLLAAGRRRERRYPNVWASGSADRASPGKTIAANPIACIGLPARLSIAPYWVIAQALLGQCLAQSVPPGSPIRARSVRRDEQDTVPCDSHATAYNAD